MYVSGENDENTVISGECLLNYSNLWIVFVSGEKQWAYIFKRGALKSAYERESADAAGALCASSAWGWHP